MNLLPLLLTLLHQPGPDLGQTASVNPADYGNCASTAGYLFLKLQGLPATYDELVRCLNVRFTRETPEPTSLAELERCLTAQGGKPLALKLSSYDDLANVTFPAIAHVTLEGGAGHYVILLRHHPQAICLLNPPQAHKWLVREQFEKIWTGAVLVSAERNPHLARSAQWRGLMGWASWLLLGVCILLAAVQLAARKWLAATLFLVSAGLLVWAIFSAAPTGYSAPADTSPLVFASRSVDLGVLPVGEHQTDLVLRNRSSAAVRDFSFTSNCTCATLTAPTEIPAGGQITVPLTLKIDPGRKTTTVTVEDKRTGQLLAAATLSWQGAGRPNLVPSWIEGVSAPLDQPFTKVLKLQYGGGEGAVVPELISCECDSPAITLKAGPNNPSAFWLNEGNSARRRMGELDLHLTVTPPTRPGPFHGHCKLRVRAGGQEHLLALNLRLRFRDPHLQLRPEVIFFSAGQAQQLVGLQRTVRIERTAAATLSLINLPSWLRGELVDLKDGAAELRLTLRAVPAPGVTEHELHVETAGPHKAKVPLKVTVYGGSPPMPKGD